MTITDGIADVPLSEAMLTLTDPQRSLVAAQIVYTLQSGIRRQGRGDQGQPAEVQGAGG